MAVDDTVDEDDGGHDDAANADKGLIGKMGGLMFVEQLESPLAVVLVVELILTVVLVVVVVDEKLDNLISSQIKEVLCFEDEHSVVSKLVNGLVVKDASRFEETQLAGVVTAAWSDDDEVPVWYWATAVSIFT